MADTAWRIAVVGAGPAGLALALHAARCLPHARITLYDARGPDHDLGADPRVLALSLGSVQFLQRLIAWPQDAAQPITTVHVSQAPPSLGLRLPEPEVRIRAAELGLPMLGAVLGYGALLEPLQRAWLAEAAAAPQRLHTRLATTVSALRPLPGGVELDTGETETHDLAVLAEGGVFAEQARKAVVADYRQAAWVGTLTLQGATPGQAWERFTRHGPVALLPLPPDAEGRARGSLVWCVARDDDPVAGLDDTQRLAVLASILPPAAGRLVAVSPLKRFELGLNAERTLVDGHTVRIGNAAQTLHPVAGQGLNLGLRDAFELVRVLRGVRHLEAALQRAEWARAADRWSLIATTDFLARSFTWQLPGAATVRGLGLAALQALPPARHWLARRLMFGLR